MATKPKATRSGASAAARKTLRAVTDADAQEEPRPRKKAKRPPTPPSGQGSALLDEVETELRRYVFLPSEHDYVAVTLWAAATHGVDNWEHATRLPIISPEKRCGKSRLLDLIEIFAHKPLMTANMSVAAVTRSITKASPPTLLVDEADAIFGTKKSAENHEELRGVFNAGYQRGRPVTRWSVTARSLEKLETFAMVAFASIKDLPDTIMDRGPVIRMRRRSKNDPVQPFRRVRDGRRLEPLGERLGEWVAEQDFTEPVTDMPVEDRAADNWEPLIAVADAAGGDWPERARNAAKVMTDGEEEMSSESFGLELLRNIRDLWLSERPDMLATHSVDLVEALVTMEETPWARYNGTGLDQNGVARLLKPYGVWSGQVKVNGKNAKGYRIDGFDKKDEPGKKVGGLQAAWDAYLPLPDGDGDA